MDKVELSYFANVNLLKRHYEVTMHHLYWFILNFTLLPPDVGQCLQQKKKSKEIKI